MHPLTLSRFLGWFSLGLGGLELAVPGMLSKGLGLPGGKGLVAAFGMREIAAGLTVLTDPGAAMGPMSRVAGDALDIGTLLSAMGRSNPRRNAAGIALLLVAGVTVLDVMCVSALAAGERSRKATAKRTYVGGRSMPAS